MSHVATVKSQIKDLGALAAGAKHCGVLLKVGQRTFKSYQGRLSPCDHAIVVPGNGQAYEVGVIKNTDSEGYSLALDPWNGGYGLVEHVGRSCEKLQQAYAAEVAIKKVKQAGFTVKKEVGQDGKIRLRCTQ